ncbi:Uncharacterised protein [uncultured Clostridium sp.]|nr:Uncharacterised protein [uncultured Clostridium sp.]
MFNKLKAQIVAAYLANDRKKRSALKYKKSRWE